MYLALHFQKRLNKSLVLIHLLICTLIHELLTGKPLDILPCCSPGATKVSKTATALEGLTLYESHTVSAWWHSCCSWHGSPCNLVRTHFEEATSPHMTRWAQDPASVGSGPNQVSSEKISTTHS